MKTHKIDFSKGINVVADKRLLPEGYLVLADNIDLRSGSIRPFKFPEPYASIQGGIPSGITCIYEFKNNWFFSILYRDYVAEYVSTQTRVYFCETGIGAAGSYAATHLSPQKVVNGVQANLGSIVPLTAPIVSATTSDTPSAFLAVVTNTGGSLATGQYSYRISAVINGQVMPPSQAVIVSVPQVGGVNITVGLITLSWHAVQMATGYIIFGRILGQEQTLFTLGAGAASVVDLGTLSPSGAFASNYQPTNPLTYVYTYVRDVGTMIDESGPSPFSNVSNASFVRIVTRNPLTDGFYSGAATYSASTNATTSAVPALTILGVMNNGNNLIITTSANSTSYPWWVNGLKAVFGSDTSLTPYPITMPTPLTVPGAPVLVQGTGSIPAGTYTYGICAIRGATTSIYNYPTNLPATTQASATTATTISGTKSVTVSWNGVSGANGYMIVRYDGSAYKVVGIVSGNTTVYIDNNTVITTLAGFPAINNTGVIFNTPSVGTVVSWENPAPISVGRIIVVTQPVPAALQVTNQNLLLAVTPVYGISSLSGTAPVLAQAAGSLGAATYSVSVVAYNGTSIIGYAPLTNVAIAGSHGIQVTYTAVAGATAYKIYYSDVSSPYVWYLAATTTSNPYTIASAGTLVTGAAIPSWGGVDQDAIYAATATTAAQIGVFTYFQDTLGVLSIPNFINFYTAANGTIGTLYDVPNNAYYKYWNIYRAGDTGDQFSFVTQVSIGLSTYTDVIGTTGLGESLPTSYIDPSSGGQVTFQAAPNDLLSIQIYNGMYFGIDGNYVRWTPTGEPDAWPSIYNQSFAFPPQRLLPYSGGLLAFCENGIYRFDGILPGQMALTQLAADGCIAPYSPLLIGESVVYLAKRGLMMVRGMEVYPITERFIPYRLITEPSAFIGGVTAPTFWWFPTDHTSAYGALLDIGMNPIPALDPYGFVTATDKPLTSLIYEARSFTWQNKYYLYFVNNPTNDFQGNPTWCVDLGLIHMAFQLPSYPITTLGFKPLDVHVSSTGECIALLNIDTTNDFINQAAFSASESQFNVAFSATAPSTNVLYRFNPTFGQNVPIRFRTGEITANAPQIRKRWREVRLNGSGTCQIRVFIDGALLTMANGQTANTLILSESPLHPSRILLPPGSWGYSCSIEICGDAVVRLIELGFDPLTGEDKE